MVNFNFHSLLSPYEFEALIRDVLEIRDSPLKFKSFRVGKDGGIDIRCTSNSKIIGQVKLHNPNNFNQLRSSLVNEVAKCKRISPDRYILAIGHSLLPEQSNDILSLFEGYIQTEEDIIDASILNKYLGHLHYQNLLKIYSKLLVPNIQFIENILESIVHKKYLNKSARELNEINKKHQLYYNTVLFSKSLELLHTNKVIIITGNPGVGKTSLGRMLIQSLVTEGLDNFYSLNGLDEIDEVYNPSQKQLFFVDDFWGSQFDNTYKSRDFLNRFNDIIYQFNESDNHYLILTSRTYIIKSVINQAEHNIKKTFNIFDLTIKMNSYSNEDKIRIFLNHLYFFDCEKDLFNSYYIDEIKSIIRHSNYTPRHIEFFLKFIYPSQTSTNDFYKSFRQYLDKPNIFWKNLSNDQSHAAQLILLILLISGDTMSLDSLKDSFINTQKSARENLNLNIQPLEFESEIKILEELFIKTHQNYNILEIQFQSPGVKDYLLEYLRENISFWGETLINTALYFNQLLFLFTTHNNNLNIQDDDSDIPLYGKKIVLNQGLKDILRQKFIKDFHFLGFSNLEEGLFNRFLSLDHDIEEAKYLKINFILDLFSANDYLDIKDFVLKEIHRDIKYIDSEHIVLNLYGNCMIEFPRTLERMKIYLNIDATKTIKAYHKSISFTNEFISFLSFSRIFPNEFENYINSNIKSIRKQIRALILDNIDYYQYYELGLELDDLIDSDIEEVCKSYGIRFTKKFLENIQGLAGRKPFFLQHTRKTRKKIKFKKSKTPKRDTSYDRIIKEYTGTENSLKNPEKIIKSYCNDKLLQKRLLMEVKNEESIFKDFFSDIHSVTSLIDFIQQNKIEFNKIEFNKITKYHFLKTYVDYYLNIKDPNLEIKVFFEYLAFYSINYNENFTKTELEKFQEQFNIHQINPSSLFPLLIQQKNWFTFLNNSVINYFLISPILKIEDNDKYREAIINVSQGPYELEIFQLLNEVDKNFHSKFITYEVNRFLESLDKVNQKSIVISFVDFFKYEFDLIPDKKRKRFDDGFCSSSEFIFENLLKFIGLDFSTSNFDIYFFPHQYDKDRYDKFFLNKDQFIHLYNRIIEKRPEKDVYDISCNSRKKGYTIILSDFIKDNQNYEILKELGLERYILSIYQEISNHIYIDKI